MSARIISLVGRVFGYLTVTSRAVSAGHRLSSWNVICRCGARITVRSDSLRNGTKFSCGACKHEAQVRSIFTTVYDGTRKF
jgi:hypothetical protein